MVTLKCDAYVRLVLLLAALLTLLILPWLIFGYGPDGFAWEHLVGRNSNVMGYPFLNGTQVVSPLLFLSCLFFSRLSQDLILHCPLS